ncbi:hypothetical protein H4CHR_02961 [Variovorax sp. PBS-H4]|uniref:hypothetical protein n=1 Tax=Variovorax sp. PBS-H4 TaxID=434008 RepID=UPI001316DB13|nr:hypothetical protein [Variovorax sp. PBS-H4]VTU32190.1 hypothetical protein H4CHR_02961 [Variovorax sp. PBS-H4]
MKQPRQLTANGKAKSASPNGGPRSGYEVVDRRGFVHLVGSMATAPQNDAAVVDISPRYEERVNGVWVAASSKTMREIARLDERGRRTYFAVRVGLLREVAGDAWGVVDGEAWHCPREYDRDRDREAFLQKALKVGLLSIGGRTYKLRVRGASPHQGGDREGHNGSTVVYVLTRAAGEIRMTHEALLMSIEQNSI